MFYDWLAFQRRRPQPKAEPRTEVTPATLVSPDTGAVQALATGVEQLCSLCENLLGLISHSDLPEEARPLMHALPEQIEAVRTCAGEIKYHRAVDHAPFDDPYSLAALGRWVWRE